MTPTGPSAPQWRKSSFSGNSTNCIEIAHLDRRVGVRDSKSPGPTLTFTRTTFTAFVLGR